MSLDFGWTKPQERVMTATHIAIADLDKSSLLAALYNAADYADLEHMGLSHHMTRNQAWLRLQESYEFDYIGGRPLKVNLSGDTLWTVGYDSRHGKGATERVVNRLRETGEIIPPPRKPRRFPLNWLARLEGWRIRRLLRKL